MFDGRYWILYCQILRSFVTNFDVFGWDRFFSPKFIVNTIGGGEGRCGSFLREIREFGRVALTVDSVPIKQPLLHNIAWLELAVNFLVVQQVE